MDEFSLEKLGERLKEIRESKGPMSLRKFCQVYDLNASVWSELERGVKPQLYITHLASLALKFDVAPTWLLFGRGPKNLSDSGILRNMLNLLGDQDLRMYQALSEAGKKEFEEKIKNLVEELQRGKLGQTRKSTKPTVTGRGKARKTNA